MSAGWRKLFMVKDGESTIGSFRLFLRNAATKLAYLCDCCPCDEKRWSVVMLCPCSDCGAFDSAGLGNDVVFPETYPSSGAPHPESGKRMWDGESPRRIVKAFEIQENAWPGAGACISGVYGQYISAIKFYLVSRADFAASVSIDLILNGTTIKTLGPISVDANEEYGWIGRSELYEGYESGAGAYESDVWYINADVDSGLNVLDLKITYDGGDPDHQLVRTIRTGIRIYLSESPNMRDVLVLPSALAHGGCEIPVIDDVTIMAYIHALKGPFDTKADAEYVRTTWSAMINAKAAKCECQPDGCDFGHPLGYQMAVYDSELGLWRLEGYGGVDDPWGSWGCDTAYVEYSVGAGTRILLRKVSADGTVSYAPATGVLAPCERITAYATSEPDPDDPDFDAKWGFGGGHWYRDPPSNDCPFCEDPNDPEAPAHCIYSNDEWDAIPNSSAELEELLGGE